MERVTVGETEREMEKEKHQVSNILYKSRLALFPLTLPLLLTHHLPAPPSPSTSQTTLPAIALALSLGYFPYFK